MCFARVIKFSRFVMEVISCSEEVGIDRWNEVDDEYEFVYKNPKKGNKKVLLKCLVMGDKLMVDALSDGAPELVHLEINVDEFATETVAGDYDAQFKNLEKLVSSLKSDVLSKLDGSPAAGPATGTSRLKLLKCVPVYIIKFNEVATAASLLILAVLLLCWLIQPLLSLLLVYLARLLRWCNIWLWFLLLMDMFSNLCNGSISCVCEDCELIYV